MIHLALVFDRAEQRLVVEEPVSAAGRMPRRLELERQYPEHEVVVISGPDRAAIERHHARYFAGR